MSVIFLLLLLSEKVGKDAVGGEYRDRGEGEREVEKKERARGDRGREEDS